MFHVEPDTHKTYFLSRDIILDCVHSVDDGLVVVEHDVPLDFERGTQLPAGQRQISRQYGEATHALSVGRGDGVGAVKAILQCTVSNIDILLSIILFKTLHIFSLFFGEMKVVV